MVAPGPDGCKRGLAAVLFESLLKHIGRTLKQQERGSQKFELDRLEPFVTVEYVAADCVQRLETCFGASIPTARFHGSWWLNVRLTAQRMGLFGPQPTRPG